jgi:hypothetical protein
MRPLNWKLSEKAIQVPSKHAFGKITLPPQPRTLRGPEARVQRLIAELKRLASKKGYSRELIASEIGVTE